jgi:hypothetical protein
MSDNTSALYTPSNKSGKDPAGDGALFDEPSSNGEVLRFDCGNRLVTPVAVWTGKCTPCRDEVDAA